MTGISEPSFGATTKPASFRPLNSKDIDNLIAGFVCCDNSDYISAIKYFKKEPEKTNNDYWYYILAGVYFKNRDYKKSLSCINLAIKLKKIKLNKNLTQSDIKYLILKAKIETENNNLEKSIGILKSILKKDPLNLKALLFISNLYIYKKDLKTAVLYLDIAKLNYPNNMNAYYILSKIYAAENKKQKAEENLLQLIKIDPYFKKGYFQLTAIYILSGKEKNAIKLFDRYLKIDPYSKTALYQSAVLNYAVKKYGIARKRFFNFLNIANKDKSMLNFKNNSLFFIGLSYIFQKKYTKGLTYLNKLRFGKHYTDAKLEEVKIYLILYKENKNDKYKAKIKNIINSLLINPQLKKSLKVYYFSAIALTEINNFSESKNVAQKGLKYFPDNTALLYELGSAYYSLKEEKKANSVMQKILRINPLNAMALNFAGYYLAVRDKDLGEAKIMIKKALRVDKNSPYILDSLGFVYYRYKEYKKAMKYFKLAVKKLSKSSTVLKHIGMDYFMLKNYRKAFKYLKKSYKIKKSKEAKRYIMRIMRTEGYAKRGSPLINSPILTIHY